MPTFPPIPRSPAAPAADAAGGGASAGGTPAQRAALRPSGDTAAAPSAVGDPSPAPGRPRLGAGPDHHHIPGDPDAQARSVWLTVIVGAALALRAIVFVLGPMTDPARAAWPDPHAGPAYGLMLQLAHHLGVPTAAWLAGQCVVSALTPLLVFALALALLERVGPALAAAAILAVHPAAVVAANGLTHEAWFTALLAAGLYAALGPRPMRADRAGLGGATLGLCWLVRPFALAWLPLLALWMWLRRPGARALAAAGALLVGGAVAPLGWYALQPQRPDAAPTAATAPAATAHPGFSRSSVLAGRLMLRPSVDRLYHEFGIPHRRRGVAEAFARGSARLRGPADPVAACLAWGWVTLNAGMLIGSLVALPVLAWRRRYLLLALLGGLMGVLTWTALPGTAEGLRLPVVVVQALLLGSLAVPGEPRPQPTRAARRRRRRDPFNLSAVETDHTDPAPAHRVGRPI